MLEEKDIDHYAMFLIDEISAWEMVGIADSDNHERIMTLGYIKGINELAGILKDALKEQ